MRVYNERPFWSMGRIAPRLAEVHDRYLPEPVTLAMNLHVLTAGTVAESILPSCVDSQDSALFGRSGHRAATDTLDAGTMKAETLSWCKVYTW